MIDPDWEEDTESLIDGFFDELDEEDDDEDGDILCG